VSDRTMSLILILNPHVITLKRGILHEIGDRISRG
jgi:hypothetical protein